eukprot:jgi/Phyca11/103150/e_gw1.7.639.1
MDKASFTRVVDTICHHPVFHNGSTFDQAPVWIQLSVALDRFGSYGTGASLYRCQRLWAVGKGTVDDYTDRVVEALLAVSSDHVRWSTKEERRNTPRRMAALGFRGCIGFIDGTTSPLAQKPSIDGECYFDRKQRYSFNAQVICDDRRWIISFFSDWPGSCGDSTIYREMKLSKHSFKRHYFSNNEYLLADSAYPADLLDNTLVPQIHLSFASYPQLR